MAWIHESQVQKLLYRSSCSTAKKAFPFQCHLVGFWCINTSLRVKETRGGKLRGSLLL
jgi:hypothetical protein